MKLTLCGHPTVGEAVAFLDANCSLGELDELVVEHALSRLPRAEATRLLQRAAARVKPGGTLLVRDLALLAGASMAADGVLDGEAVLVDRRSFWTPDQVANHLLPDFRTLSRRVTEGGAFEATFGRIA